jgi:hypothetical protein
MVAMGVWDFDVSNDAYTVLNERKEANVIFEALLVKIDSRRCDGCRYLFGIGDYTDINGVLCFWQDSGTFSSINSSTDWCP